MAASERGRQQRRSRRGDDDTDLFFNPERQQQVNAVAQARASLRNPTRPMTPMMTFGAQLGTDAAGAASAAATVPQAQERQLFYGTDYSRPATTLGPLVPGRFETPRSARLRQQQQLQLATKSAPASPAGAVKGVEDATQPQQLALEGSPGRDSPRKQQQQQQRRSSVSPRKPPRISAIGAAAGGVPASLQRASEELAMATGTVVTAAPAAYGPYESPPEFAAITPDQAVWEEVKTLRPALNPDADPALVEESCRRLCELVDPKDAALMQDPLSAPWLSLTRRQQFLLTPLSKLMNSQHGQNPDTALKLCRVYLALRPPGQISLIAKTIYSQSKIKDNDLRFKYDGIFPGMMRIIAQPQAHDFQTLLYISGALKHLSDGELVRTDIIAHDAVLHFANLIRPEVLEKLRLAMRSTDSPDARRDAKDSTRMGQLLVQVTAVLRNLAINTRETKRSFVESNVMVSLCKLAPAFSKHSELALNISRILSKLTLWHECLESLVAYPDAVPDLLKLLHDSSSTPALVVRVCFVLGNLTGLGAESEQHRLQFKEHNNIPGLIGMLLRYNAELEKALAGRDVGVGPAGDSGAPMSLQQQLQQDASLAPPEELEQVLVKLIRLLANIAISPEVGPIVAKTQGITVLSDLLYSKKPEKSEELVLNVVGAITNLSYYNEHGGYIASNQADILLGLVPLLLVTNEEVVIESVRAYSNFSRNRKARKVMFVRRIYEIMTVLLQHPNREVVFNACGVVMNLITDCAREYKDQCQAVVPQLLQILSSNLEEAQDVDIILVAGKTLYNIITEGGPSIMSQDHIIVLRDLLQKPVWSTTSEMKEVNSAISGVLE